MKTKKRIIAIALLVIIGFIGYKIVNTLNYKEEVAQRIQTLPSFSFKTIKGTTYTEEQVAEKPTVFIYFNSDCDYCKSEATKIKEHLPKFKNTHLIFISFEDTKGIIQFAKNYGFDTQSNITFLQDTKGEFSEIFDAKSIPYILVYNSNKNLVKKFKGATKIDAILSAIN